jgi:hypothetical protein
MPCHLVLVFVLVLSARWQMPCHLVLVLSARCPDILFLLTVSETSFILFLFSVPGAPVILPDECSSENNSVTISWMPCPGTNPAEFYVLELDDGTGNGTGNGTFREVNRNGMF